MHLRLLRDLMGAQVYPLLASGVFGTYGYFIVDEETGHAVLIDPGAQPELFMGAAQEQGWTVEKILLTHGYFGMNKRSNSMVPNWYHSSELVFL